MVYFDIDQKSYHNTVIYCFIAQSLLRRVFWMLTSPLATSAEHCVVGSGPLVDGSWLSGFRAAGPLAVSYKTNPLWGEVIFCEGVNIQEVLIQTVLVPLEEPYPLARSTGVGQHTHVHTQ